ncbi:hypothetical protein Hypma_004708 [Hypsizygus marmoreus]|uniref:Uncharacterized protein n=1 Tax=Hypsizygus marmoreus TaxID=39966 RepID=A0A369IZP2_HYPMA|nr:hypothetical protein Hypma_004708 [Hypsizygus marmoreus]
MGDAKNKRKRQPAGERPQKSRSRAGVTAEEKEKENSSPSSQPRPKPRPVGRKKTNPVSAPELSHDTDTFNEAEADAIAVLAGLGGSGLTSAAAPPPRSFIDRVVDHALGIGEDEAKELDELQREEEEDTGRSDDSSSSEEEDEGFDIKYLVPHKGGTRQLTVKSTSSWDDFSQRLAEKMETRVRLLTDIGYIPSYIPKSQKPLPKLLEDDESYAAMIEDIEEYIDACKEKNKGKGKVKSFYISIVDTDPGDVPGKGNTSSNKKTSKSKEPQPAAPLEDGDEQEHKLLKQLVQRHACAEHHGKACYIMSDGKHYQYTNADLTIWATLLRRRLATIDSPPDKLNLSEKTNRQENIKAQAATSPLGFMGGNPWAQMNPMMNPWGAFGMPSPWAMPPPPNPYALPAHFLTHPSVPAGAPLPADDNAMSSPYRKRPAEPLVPLKYPTTRDWLTSLDNHVERGEDQLNYVQYIPIFLDAGLVRLGDILACQTPEKLRELTQINWGTANRLMDYAKEDRENLVVEAKRVRTE